MKSYTNGNFYDNVPVKARCMESRPEFDPERHHKGMLLPLGTGHMATCAVIKFAGRILILINK
jgi:hypothetical protein